MIREFRRMNAAGQIKMDFSAIDRFLLENATEIQRLNFLDEIDHENVVRLKLQALRVLWDSFKAEASHGMSVFDQVYLVYKNANRSWLPDHMLYMLLKAENLKRDPMTGWDWRTWKERDARGVEFKDSKERLQSEIEFLSFVQFIAASQLQHVKEKGREKGVEIAVDMPFARDGADVWLHPEIFGLKDANGYQRSVTQGVPAEPAYPAGQYWQFYPYDWFNPETAKYLLELFEFYQSRATYVRLDHVLGFYRTFLFTEDVDGEMTLEKLGIYKEVEKIRQEALSRISEIATGTNRPRNDGTPENAVIASREDGEAISNSQVVAIQNEAVARINQLIKEKLQSLKPGQVPSLPDDAVKLTLRPEGKLYKDAMVSIAREVPKDQWGSKLPVTSAWQRREVVEKKVFRRKPVWDFISIAQGEGNEAAGEEGMRQWLFGDSQGPLPEDSLRLAYFKLAPGEAILSEFLRLAQEKGSVLIFETLGTVPEEIQDTVTRLEGYNYLPVIWGFHDGSPYHPSRHTLNSLAVFGLHDSSTLRARWENELTRNEKEKIMAELFPHMDPKDYGRYLGKLFPEVHGALLKMVFNSEASMAIPTWLDILGYGNERRLNIPGESLGQWTRRLPVTMESLLAATNGKNPDGNASNGIKLLKYLVQVRDGQSVAFGRTNGNGTILGTDPDTASGLIQIRPIRANSDRAQPFLVEAFTKEKVKEFRIIVTDKDGSESVYPMKSGTVGSGLVQGVSRYAIQIKPVEAGAYRYRIQVIKPDGKTEESKSGYLVAVNEGDELNPLSPGYVTSKYIEQLDRGQQTADQSQETKHSPSPVLSLGERDGVRGLQSQVSSLKSEESRSEVRAGTKAVGRVRKETHRLAGKLTSEVLDPKEERLIRQVPTRIQIRKLINALIESENARADLLGELGDLPVPLGRLSEEIRRRVDWLIRLDLVGRIYQNAGNSKKTAISRDRAELVSRFDSAQAIAERVSQAIGQELEKLSGVEELPYAKASEKADGGLVEVYGYGYKWDPKPGARVAVKRVVSRRSEIRSGVKDPNDIPGVNGDVVNGTRVSSGELRARIMEMNERFMIKEIQDEGLLFKAVIEDGVFRLGTWPAYIKGTKIPIPDAAIPDPPAQKNSLHGYIASGPEPYFHLVYKNYAPQGETEIAQFRDQAILMARIFVHHGFRRNIRLDAYTRDSMGRRVYGEPNPTTLGELAALLLSSEGSRSEIRHLEYRAEGLGYSDSLLIPNPYALNPGEALDRIAAKLRVAKEVTGNIVAIGVTKLKSFASVIVRSLFPEHFNAVPVGALAGKSREKAKMLLGMRTATASDVFVLGHGFFSQDYRAAVGMRRVYSETPIVAIVKTDAERAFLEGLNLRLKKEGMLEILATGSENAGELKAHLGMVRNPVVRTLLFNGETIPAALIKQLPEKNRMNVTPRMMGGFLNAVDMLVSGLLSGLQAQFATARSA